jgi:hypothetical protein
MRFFRLFQRDNPAEHPLRALFADPPVVTLNERQAKAARDALWFAVTTNVLPQGSQASIEAFECLAVISRRLQPELGDEAATMVSMVDQLRAGLDSESGVSSNT